MNDEARAIVNSVLRQMQEFKHRYGERAKARIVITEREFMTLAHECRPAEYGDLLNIPNKTIAGLPYRIIPSPDVTLEKIDE